MKKLNLLFLCTGNSCRSQMAEGWVRHLWPDLYEAWSAGVVKHGLNPLAVKAMAEAGVDIGGQQSKAMEDLPIMDFDYIFTLCDQARESCPYFPGRTIHQGFSDPPQLAAGAASEEEALVHYRRVRDEIRAWVEKLPHILY